MPSSPAACECSHRRLGILGQIFCMDPVAVLCSRYQHTQGCPIPQSRQAAGSAGRQDPRACASAHQAWTPLLQLAFRLGLDLPVGRRSWRGVARGFMQAFQRGMHTTQTAHSQDARTRHRSTGCGPICTEGTMLNHTRYTVPSSMPSLHIFQCEHAPACSSEVVPFRSWMPQRSTTSMLAHCCWERPAWRAVLLLP